MKSFFLHIYQGTAFYLLMFAKVPFSTSCLFSQSFGCSEGIHFHSPMLLQFSHHPHSLDWITSWDLCIKGSQLELSRMWSRLRLATKLGRHLCSCWLMKSWNLEALVWRKQSHLVVKVWLVELNMHILSSDGAASSGFGAVPAGTWSWNDVALTSHQRECAVMTTPCACWDGYRSLCWILLEGMISQCGANALYAGARTAGKAFVKDRWHSSRILSRSSIYNDWWIWTRFDIISNSFYSFQFITFSPKNTFVGFSCVFTFSKILQFAQVVTA